MSSDTTASSVSTSSTSLSTDSQYVALGYTGLTCHVWSKARNCIIDLSAKDVVSPGVLTIICGSDWLKKKHGFTHNGTEKINYKAVGEEIIHQCNVKGSFRVSEVYGTGVWRDSSNPDTLIINSGSDIWRTDNKDQERVSDRCVFISHGPLGLKRTQAQAKTGEAKVVLETLSTWNWRRECDAYLMFGWVMSACFAGANNWRAHAALTAPPGCGKSTLLGLIRNLLGDFVINVAGTTSEPAIRRVIQNDSLAVMVDEAEGTSNVKTIMGYLRSSSTGDRDIKATQGQSGVETYTVRCAGLISAVNLPAFEAADEGRYLPLSLSGEPKNKNCLPEIVREGNKLVEPLGLKLRSRMIYSWPSYRKSSALIRSLLINEDDLTIRYADSLSTVLAAAWTALNDGVITESAARELIKTIDFSEEKRKLEEIAYDTSVIDHALGTRISAVVEGKTEMITLRMALGAAAHGDKDAISSVQSYGMKTVFEDGVTRLLVNERSVEFKKLYRGSKWEHIDFATALMRVPGASQKKYYKTACIGGESCRPVSLPFDFEWQD